MVTYLINTELKLAACIASAEKGDILTKLHDYEYFSFLKQNIKIKKHLYLLTKYKIMSNKNYANQS